MIMLLIASYALGTVDPDDEAMEPLLPASS